MLIRASGQLTEGVYLIALNDCCVYAVGTPDKFCLIDCGPTCYLDLLLTRLTALGFKLRGLHRLFSTNFRADRMGALPALRRLALGMQVTGSAKIIRQTAQEAFARAIFDDDQNLITQTKSTAVKAASWDDFKAGLRIDSPLSDVESFSLENGGSLRVIPFPSHTEDSRAFYIVPQNFLIVDHGLGYFRGREFAAPGADYDLPGSLKLFERLKNIEISSICFPCIGAISGSLVHRHLGALRQNTQDLINETQKALSAGVSLEEITTAIREAFYKTESADIVLINSIMRTFDNIWRQLSTRKNVTNLV